MSFTLSLLSWLSLYLKLGELSKKLIFRPFMQMAYIAYLHLEDDSENSKPNLGHKHIVQQTWKGIDFHALYQTKAICWSGWRVQVWVQIWAPYTHWAVTAPEGNRRLVSCRINNHDLGAALWQSFGVLEQTWRWAMEICLGWLLFSNWFFCIFYTSRKNEGHAFEAS